MRIAIGSDHGGFAMKGEIISLLVEQGHEVRDLGTDSEQSVHYPDFARAVCGAVAAGEAERGILVCGTGIGMSMAANRNPAIRAALCHDGFTARMSREHNDANVLCLGERVLGIGVALDIVDLWMRTEFAGGRHLTRINMF
ncbi:MAG: ribose 5-phosphate isomerase B [Thermodesulfobacteriota bacterium]